MNNHRKILTRSRPLLAGLLLVLAACDRPEPARVVVYTSVDQVFARQLFERFEQQTGIAVAPVFDTEAGKTTGLVQRLRREKASPRADVWLSSEVFGTLALQQEGVLAQSRPGGVAELPTDWQNAEGYWFAFAPRARVLAFDPTRLPAEKRPTRWQDCVPSKLGGGVAIANPQFGTTRGHFGAMFALWGAESATAFVEQLRAEGVLIADGNAQAVRLVETGQAVACWTDTDDVWVAQRRGVRIELLYPDLTEGSGTLWIPCSAARVAGRPDNPAAQELLDFLASETVERALAESDSRNVPLRGDLRQELGIPGPQPSGRDFEAIAAAVPEAMRVAREVLLR